MIGRIPCMNAVRLHGFIEGVKMRPCALHHVFVSDLLLDEENGRMDRWTGGFRKSYGDRVVGTMLKSGAVLSFCPLG